MTQSAFVGNTDLAVGNAVGSNIFNVLFVLGLSALAAPLFVTSRLIRKDVPLMIGASFLMLLLAVDGHLSRLDGAILFGCLVTYLIWTIQETRKAKRSVQREFAEVFSPPTVRALVSHSALFVTGLVSVGWWCTLYRDGLRGDRKTVGCQRADNRFDGNCDRYIASRGRHLGRGKLPR